MLAAFFMVFIPTVGEYVTPLLVGGPHSWMFGNIIQLWAAKARISRGVRPSPW